MPPDEVSITELSENLIPDKETENKAIRIESDQEIQVLVYYRQQNSLNYNDVYQVPSLDQSSTEYHTAVHTPAETCVHRMYFYVVTSFTDDASLEITPFGESSFEVTLGSFGSYVHTWRSDSEPGQSSFISSSAPVAVISGNLCGYNSGGDDPILGNYAASVPPVATLGQHYVVPNLRSETASGYAGYSIHVVATDDDTEVTCGGESRQLSTKGWLK